LRLARPDLEREAARWVGDVSAHEGARVLGSARQWLLASLAASERDIVEYLQEEGRALPAATESHALGRQIGQLHDDVERLLARIERLERTGHG
jgi:ubiquinone biosynthesis accessory factor UbiJ